MDVGNICSVSVFFVHPSRQSNISTSGEERFKYLLPWENKVSHMLYPRANKNNQIPTPCPASLSPPPPSITLIGALAGRSSDTARSRNQSDCRIWRISLARKLGKRQSVATVVLLKTSKKNQEQFPNLMKAFADWTFKSFRPELIFYQTIMFHSLLRN